MAESGEGSEPEPERLTGPFRKGYDPRRGKGPRPRNAPREPDPNDGLTLSEKMSRVLTEEWTTADLRKLARDDPAGYRRLMELARKLEPPSGSTQGPADPAAPVKDEATARCVELAEKLLADLGDRHQ